jgi:copper chaperone CopZ
MASYVHSVGGRLRIKIATVKGSQTRAGEVERRIAMLRGVERTEANPLTGNVLVLYDPECTGLDDIVDALRAWGYLREMPARASTPNVTGEHLAIVVIRAMAEFALTRLITTLV